MHKQASKPVSYSPSTTLMPNVAGDSQKYKLLTTSAHRSLRPPELTHVRTPMQIPKEEKVLDAARAASDERTDKKLAPKRFRRENWADEEELLLVELYRKHFLFQDCGSMNRAAKNQTWLNLAAEFDSLTQFAPRDMQRLRSKFKCMKALVKKALNELGGTPGNGSDGGQRPRMGPAEKLIAEIFSNSPAFNYTGVSDGLDGTADSGGSVEWPHPSVHDDAGEDQHPADSRQEVEILDDGDDYYAADDSSSHCVATRNDTSTTSKSNIPMTDLDDARRPGSGRRRTGTGAPQTPTQLMHVDRDDCDDEEEQRYRFRSLDALQREVLVRQMRLLEQQEALLALRSVKNRKSIELLNLQVCYMKNKMAREGLPVTPPPGDASQSE